MTLPNFMIVGVERCGTTSLYNWLREHPEICMSEIKEACFYAAVDERSVAAAKSRREYESMWRSCEGRKAIGEACPSYLHSREAADRIRADIPDVKLIAILRDPAERAYSHWLLQVQRGGEWRPVEKVLQPGETCYEHSFYAAALRRFMRTFPPANLKVVLFDDLTSRPDEVMHDIFQFLAVDPEVRVNTGKAYNAASSPRSLVLNSIFNHIRRAIRKRLPARLLPQRVRKIRAAAQKTLLREREPLPPGLRLRLVDAYRNDIIETGELIGRDLSHWLSERSPGVTS